jgi:hypothetical protein
LPLRVCRSSSALGLEHPGDVAAALAPESEKTSGAAALVTMMAIATHTYLPSPRAGSPALVTIEAEEEVTGARQDSMEGPRVVHQAHEIPSSEPIVPHLPTSTILPVACLILVGEVAGTQQ